MIEIPEMNEQVAVRLEKIKKMREMGLNPFRNDKKPSISISDFNKKFGSLSKEELEKVSETVALSGRVIAIRDFGKGAFIRIQDCYSSAQAFLSLGDLKEIFEHYKNFLDVGDIVYISGKPFKTKTQELALHTFDFAILTKSMRPLPEKFHGITDIELRYRHRSLDLIMTEKSRQTFLKRTKIISLIRKFFDDRGFLEVETPMMHAIAGGAAARPFKTHHNALDMPLYLRIAPELHLKRLVVGGFERVYEMNRLFRNEGISIKHNPEFTSIEFYWAYATYEDLMNLTEELFQKLALEVNGDLTLKYQGKEINLKSPWTRLTVKEAVQRYSDFKDISKMNDREALYNYCKQKQIHTEDYMSTGALLMAIFDSEVEKNLIQPTFITQYPTDVSPLSRRNDKDPSIVDRFELYMNGWEVANAFSELNDPIDQRERFIEQMKAKEAGDEEACDIDEEFLYALEHAMPPTAGEGIGIDRLVMLFTDSASIRDVILFPLLRPTHHN
jgi:lysyl-tRNA synthetase class 2